jgi:hypothetical protein
MVGSVLVLAGCTSEPVNNEISNAPIIESSLPSPSESPAIPPQNNDEIGGGELVPNNYMPAIIPFTEIPSITIRGDYPINVDTANDVFQWAASLAWLSLNDDSLQDPQTLGEKSIQGLLPYVSAEAAEKMLDAVRKWERLPDPLNPDTLFSSIWKPMFFVLSPKDSNFGEFVNNPIYSNVTVLDPVIERITSNSVEPRYKVSFTITAMLYLRVSEELCAQDPQENVCGDVFYVGLAYDHVWEIADTGGNDSPYLLDTWKQRSPAYGSVTNLSD